MEVEYASKGVAGSGLGLGIAGTALGLLNGGLNGVLGGGCNNGWNHGCSENSMVNRYELAQESRISKLESEIALRDANIYNDQKLLELYKYVDGKFAVVEHELCDQRTYNAVNTTNICCIKIYSSIIFNGIKQLFLSVNSGLHEFTASFHKHRTNRDFSFSKLNRTIFPNRERTCFCLN